MTKRQSSCIFSYISQSSPRCWESLPEPDETTSQRLTNVKVSYRLHKVSGLERGTRDKVRNPQIWVSLDFTSSNKTICLGLCTGGPVATLDTAFQLINGHIHLPLVMVLVSLATLPLLRALMFFQLAIIYPGGSIGMIIL